MRSSRNIAVVGLLAWTCWSCSGGGGGGSDPGPDTTAPRVTSTNPGADATGVAKGAAITAIFSEALDPATVTTATFSLAATGGAAVAGGVGWNGGTRTATFTPLGALLPSTSYTATIAGVEDAAGNPMAAAHVWSFETAAPSAGDLDPGFGAGGIARTDLGGTNFDEAWGMAIQQDDKIVVVGGSDVQLSGGIGSAFTLARYDADGTLDPTFGPGGIVTTAIGDCSAAAQAVALQQDGKIVAAGTCGFDVAVARYATDGTLDPAFGASGVTLLVRSGTQTANAVAIDADGNIIVAGESDAYASATNASDFLVQRLTPAGALDTSFSTDGVAYVDFKPAGYTSGSGLWDVAYAVAAQGDGTVVVAGAAENGAWNYDIGLAHLASDGSRLSQPRVSIGSLKNNVGRAVTLQQDGKVVVAANVENHLFGVLRLSASLSLDTSFSGDGIASTDLRNDGTSSEDRPYAVMVQPDGKIVAAGRVRSGSGGQAQDLAIARYTAAGALDTSFGTAGVVLTDAGDADDVLVGVGRQSSGKLVVAGTSGGDFFVARYVP